MINKMNNCWLTVFIIAVLILLYTGTAYCAPGPDGTEPAAIKNTVPASRLEKLTRGINIHQPYWNYQWGRSDFNQGYAGSVTDDDDIALIKSLGFRHVRLAVLERDLMDPDRPERLNQIMKHHLVRAVDRLLDAGLAVVIDIHASEEFKLRLEAEPGLADDFALFWQALAKNFSRTDPEMLFFELMNEPMYEVEPLGEFEVWPFDPKPWDAVLAKLVPAVRKAAPNHTIIVGGVSWNSVDGLMEMALVNDPNVVYSFHFYEPWAFTHQGAEYADYPYNRYRDLPYPSSPEAVEQLLREFPTGTDAKIMLSEYGEKRHRRESLERFIKLAAQWSEKTGQPVICSEFGVYREHCPRESYLRWHKDTRELLEQYGIGWCKWDFDEHYGVIVYMGEFGDTTNAEIDYKLLVMLGLMTETGTLAD